LQLHCTTTRSHAAAVAAAAALLFHPGSKLTKDVKMHVQRCLDNGTTINVPHAIKISTISKGLKYSLATGNWGQQGTQGVRAGVSQVRAAALRQCVSV
jgi:DNA-directed RNA polymerase beta subunit